MNEEFKDVLERKIKLLPKNSGVYLMKDRDGTVIYVGKAKVLKNRVTQYFRNSSSHTPKVLMMVENIADFEYIITGNEMEALILECNLIKKYRPYYNILMRDDKSYPYIKLTVKDDYPRLFITRTYENDGSRYFGPYANATYAKLTVQAINEMYPTVMCTKNLKEGKKTGELCLNYHLGLCAGACQGFVDKKTYDGYVSEIIKILGGDNSLITAKLTEKMNILSSNLEYEQAGKVRDRIFAIKGLNADQNVSNTTADNMDIIGIALGDDMSCAQVFELRDKKIVGRECFIMKGESERDMEEVLSSFIKQYYTNIPYIPPVISVERDFEDREILEQLLTSLSGKKTRLHVPKRGEKKRLIEMAMDNAKLHLENTVGREKQRALLERKAVEEINSFAGISKENPRYEAYDISNISGTSNIGVMVAFDGARKNSKAYRKFRIKSVDGQDDYQSMMEVVFRRLNRAFEEERNGDENPKFLPVPDIIFVDGGVGHVNAVKSIVDAFPDFDIKVLGLEKNSRHRLKEIVTDSTHRKKVSDFDYAVKLLNDMSEEVHRYAIDYHRNMRSRNLLKSSLEDIEGIGKVKSKNLMKHFRNMGELKKASVEEIEKVPGMNRKLAERVKDFVEDEF